MTVAGNRSRTIQYSPDIGVNVAFNYPRVIYNHPQQDKVFFIADDNGISVLCMFETSFSY